uniref:ferritin heavy chain-like n=1 Tax=Jaculus jaculus TaxID=51337 RepID=UPI001E1B4E31|nr:ferritin heavy chain-like [Jaculus jaculus]XP_044996792.1 ferritin heavy chain-like [Jaculus jaculus]
MVWLRGHRRRRRHRCPLRFSQARVGYPLVFLQPPVAPLAPLPSQVRHNYHPECETAINSHIKLQLYSSYVYLSMAFYCDRDDVALGNFTSFFLSKSQECTVHSEMFLSLQNQRGGRISLDNINKPDRSDWLGGLSVMEDALQLELTLNQSLLDLHQLAIEKGDTHLCNFLQHHCLQQQANVLKEIGGYLTNLRQMRFPENGMAEYLFGRLSLPGTSKK